MVKVMKYFALVAFVEMAAWASPVTLCPPVMTPDSQRVAANCSGLGQQVVAQPGTVAEVWWNDNWGGGDYDFNDAVVRVWFDQADHGLMQWVGKDSNLNNQVTMDGVHFASAGSTGVIQLGQFTVGQVVGLEMVNGLGQVFYSGGVGANPDCGVHAWVHQELATPEPVSMWLMGVGLVLVGWVGKRR